MKRILIVSGAVILLSGCTAVPVPVSVAPYFSGLIPQSPPLARNPYSADNVPLLPYAELVPAVATSPTITTPPTLSPSAPAVSYQPSSTATHGIAQNMNDVAGRIFRNETGGDVRKLVEWNAQENFAVLGIGHFVWYPVGKRGRYTETFPAFLSYVEANKVPLPQWLAQRPTRGGPWPDKAAFERAQNDSQMNEMRNFLQKTLNLQANFMAGRLKQSLPEMVKTLPAAKRERALKNFQVLEQSPGGMYPVLDYVHFKGDGTNPNERYRGEGWGLVQVLQSMETVSPGRSALAEFMRAADDLLVRRVANSPAERREARQLAEWQKRLRTYAVTSSVASR